MEASPSAGSTRSHERLLPSVLLAPDLPGLSRRRTARDWIVDVLAAAGTALVGVVSLLAFADVASHGISRQEAVVDVVLGALAIGALFWRRRYPMAVGAVTVVLATFSATAGGAALFALFSIAVHRPLARASPVAAFGLVGNTVAIAVRPLDQAWLTSQGVMVAFTAAVVAMGMVVRARRQLVWTLRERAMRAEAEQQLRTDQARSAERARIAREMHDVLGHRISMIALHAGGLEVRSDLPPAEIANTAGLLRANARQALEELRAIIGILRDDGSVDAPSAPQPTLADIHRLVAETRQAGTTVSLAVDVGDAATAASSGRVAYRVVQEGLTNVAKHARGAAAFVEVNGDPATGLAVKVRNAVGRTGGMHTSALPSGGVGLIGLRERVELAGGTLRHGINDQGEFVLAAELSWS